MPHSLVMIPVPELDGVVGTALRRRSPGLVPADPGVPAHITLLGPFMSMDSLTEGVLDELGAFFADVTPFTFTLTGVHQFPGGGIYLAPEPAQPFRRLTLALFDRFPEHPPYGGAFDDVVPHLSLPLPDGGNDWSLPADLGVRLPLRVHAREASLYWSEEGASRTLATFPFGTTAA
ncbi:MAG: 2'-5' RNA ligase family protein [Nocardioidaceae bacterium]|nr:2'-5' RNA ligase family protein [Nocardioidaceae bacterium]